LRTCLVLTIAALCNADGGKYTREANEPAMIGIGPAMVTPRTADGEIAVEAIPMLIEKFIEAGSKGVYLVGSTGAGFALTVPQRKLVTEVAIKAVAGRIAVLVHVGGCPIEDAIDLTKHAEAAGADVISTSVPGAYDHLKGIKTEMTLEKTMDYFHKVAAATTLDFWPYWFGIEGVTATDFLDAMDDVPNFTGMKWTSYDLFTFQRIQKMAEQRGRKLTMISGPDEMNVAAMAMGSGGAIGSTYNIMPKMFVNMRNAFESGDTALAMEIQEQANEVIQICMDVYDFKVSGFNIISALMAYLRRDGIPVGKPPAVMYTRDFTEADETILFAKLDALPFTIE